MYACCNNQQLLAGVFENGLAKGEVGLCLPLPKECRWVMGGELRKHPAESRIGCIARGRLLVVDEDVGDLLYYGSALRQNWFDVRS